VIFPNPAKGHFTIRINKIIEKTGLVEIFNIYGQQVKKEIYQTGTNERIISCNDLGKGTYILQLTTNSEIFRESVTIK
jgi:hypothetical protein